jgi:hypothetical protein
VADDALRRFVDDVRRILVAGERTEATSTRPVATATGTPAPTPAPTALKPQLIRLRYRPEDADRKAIIDEAFKRLASLSSGKRLLQELHTIFWDAASRKYRAEIGIDFVRTLDQDDDLGAGGYVRPQGPGAARYRIVAQYPPDAMAAVEPGVFGSEGIVSGLSYWPPTAAGYESCRIYYRYSDAASVLAETLYHELLHIWYFYRGADGLYPTGHGDASTCEIADDFLARIKTFIRELDT